MPDMEIQPATEFQALPLEFIVSAPLTAAVKAQAVASETTLNFIKGLIPNGVPTKVSFSTDYNELDDNNVVKKRTLKVEAPLLSLVPIPHLRIDKVKTCFRFEITQSFSSKEVRDKGLEIGAETGALLSPWVNATLKGSVSSKSSEESIMNRSGVLEVTVEASESPIPEGLARILNLLSRSVPIPPAQE